MKVYEQDWKINAIKFFKDFERKILKRVPKNAEVKDIKFSDDGITEIVYEE